MLWVLIIGLMVGVVAKFLMPGNEPGGFIMTILLGIGGAMVANWAGGAFGAYHHDEPVGFIAAVAGAMAILFVYKLLLKRKGRSIRG
jgi:uncharacterized membrane protein YeaQ/YmgE (transglycosylase-associated protein family)